MKIAIARCGPPDDGIERVVEDQAQALAAAGHEAVVIERGEDVAEVVEAVRRCRLAGGIDLLIAHDPRLCVALRRAFQRMAIVGAFESDDRQALRAVDARLSEAPLLDLVASVSLEEDLPPVPSELRRRIVIDGSMARVGGGSTFTRELPAHLARLAPHSRFLLLLRDPRVAGSIPELENLEVRLLPEVGAIGLLRFPLMQARTLARSWSADLWFSAGELTPEGLDCACVATFQNSVPWSRVPMRLSPRHRLRVRVLRALSRRSVERSARILFLSADSARWMGREIGVPRERRAVLHCGIDRERWRPADGARRHVLAVGSIYEHKNYVRLVEAWTALAREDPSVPDLLIVGKPVDAAPTRRLQAAREAAGNLAPRIRLVGWATDEELRDYTRDAALFVFPSLLETFGIPLVEAMAARIPLVASDLSVFREVAADAALFAEPTSAAAFTAKMREALTDREATRRRLEIGERRATRLTWERSAQRLLALFGELEG